MLGTSASHNAGLCADMSRSITTESKNGIVEFGGGDSFGVVVGKSAAFQRGPLRDVSRTIDTNGSNGVLLWTKQDADK